MAHADKLHIAFTELYRLRIVGRLFLVHTLACLLAYQSSPPPMPPTALRAEP